MPIQNGINNFQTTTIGGIPLSNYKFPRAYINNSINGRNDFYTCPAGKRAAVYCVCYYNSTAGTLTSDLAIKVSGNYYKIINTTSITTLANAIGRCAIILEPGESLSASINGTGVNAFAKIIEFDNNVSIFTKKLLGTAVASGDNTLYTVPAGKSALLLDQNLSVSLSQNNAFFCCTATGTTFLSYAVPNGGSKGTGNQTNPSTFTSTNTLVNFNSNPTLNSGDFMVFNSSSVSPHASFILYTNVVEI